MNSDYPYTRSYGCPSVFDVLETAHARVERESRLEGSNMTTKDYDGFGNVNFCETDDKEELFTAEEFSDAAKMYEAVSKERTKELIKLIDWFMERKNLDPDQYSKGMTSLKSNIHMYASFMRTLGLETLRYVYMKGREAQNLEEKAQLLLGDTYMRFLAVPETIRDQIIVDFIARYQELYPGSETRPTPKEKQNDHT